MDDVIKFKRNGRYEVHSNGVFVSRHNEEHVAKSKAATLKIKSPKSLVEIIPPSFEADVNMGMLQFILNSGGSGGSTPITPDPLLNPVLYNFRIENDTKNRVYFDSLQPLQSGSDASGFTISDKNGSLSSISTTFISSGNVTGHYFELSSSFTYWDNNTIRYEGNNSLPWITGNSPSNIQDADGNVLYDFTLAHIQSNITEPTTVADRFVNASATGSGDGTSDANAWTMAQAIANTDNYTIWVKAGTYSGRYAIPYRSSTHVIKFIGYTSTTGDITYKVGKNEPTNASMFPVFDGGNRATGVGIDTSSRGNYIFKNIQFIGSENAVFGNTTYNLVFENISARELGAISSQGGDGFAIESGVLHSSTYNVRIVGCSVTNGTSTNIGYRGNNGLIKDCFSYCDQAPAGSQDVIAATDYYYQIAGSNNIIMNPYAEKNTPNGDGHLGHGVSLKAVLGTTEHNLIDGGTVIGIFGGVQFRWDDTKYCVARNMTITESPTNPRAGSQVGSNGVMFFSGGERNIFENGYIEGVDSAICYQDNDETTANSAGNENIVKNSVFNGCEVVVYAFNSNATTSVNSGNQFLNNTIYNSDYFYRIKDSNMTFNDDWDNNVFVDITTLDDPLENASAGFNYDTNNIFNSFASSIGTNSTNLDPQFTDAANDDFTIENPALDGIGANN